MKSLAKIAATPTRRNAIASAGIAEGWTHSAVRPPFMDESPHEHAAEETTHEFEYGSNGPDDALGLYLRQMGSIPLLTREQELTLAKRLETARRRYRRAVLFSW